MHPINDEAYKKILVDSLTAAHDMLSQNEVIMQKVIPEDRFSEYSQKNNFTLTMLSNVKSRVENGMPLNPVEGTIVGRALVEYIQKVELAQSHFIHMIEDVSKMSDLQFFKDTVKDIHMAQMRFSHEQSLEMSQKSNLMNRPPRPGV